MGWVGYARTWDITRSPTAVRGQYFNLYLILDLYSRAAVGWMVADRESAQLAERLVRITTERHAIGPGTLTLDADRGAPMTSKTLATRDGPVPLSRSLKHGSGPMNSSAPTTISTATRACSA